MLALWLNIPAISADKLCLTVLCGSIFCAHATDEMQLAGARANKNHGSSQSHIRTRLPNAEEVFFEGYLHRKTPTLLGITKWTRLFCILQQDSLLFHGSWSSLSDDIAPQSTLLLDHTVQVELLPDNYLALHSPSFSSSPVTLYFNTEEDCLAWKAMLELEISRNDDGGLQLVRTPKVRARFFEGYLFKTPPSAERWEERWFELNGNGRLTYSQGFGQPVKGTIDLETCKIVCNKTDAQGIPTPYYFQIHTFEKISNGGEFRKRTFNLAAPTQLDYLNWLKALKVWVGVQRPAPYLGGNSGGQE